MGAFVFVFIFLLLRFPVFCVFHVFFLVFSLRFLCALSSSVFFCVFRVLGGLCFRAALLWSLCVFPVCSVFVRRVVMGNECVVMGNECDGQ